MANERIAERRKGNGNRNGQEIGDWIKIKMKMEGWRRRRGKGGDVNGFRERRIRGDEEGDWDGRQWITREWKREAVKVRKKGGGKHRSGLRIG